MGEVSQSPTGSAATPPVDELQELVPSDADAGGAAAEGDQALEDGELDVEAQALLKELESSQEEVQRMLGEQRVQAAELGGLKDSLAAELSQLQDETWKLQVYSELEMLKRQLAAIGGVGTDLDSLESKMAALDEEEAALLADNEEALGEGADGPEGLGDDLQGIEELQDDLDAELAAMQRQLEAIRAESAAVTARKAHLELELLKLLQEGVDDAGLQLGQMGLGEGEDEEAGAKAQPLEAA